MPPFFENPGRHAGGAILPMKSLDPKTVVLLGVPFHDVTMAETLDEIDAIVADRTPRYLATANLDFAAQASTDVELQRILLDAHLVLCDGTPLIWASRWLGVPLRERVAGSDLTPKLAERAAARGHRLFFLGSDEAVLKLAQKTFEERYPGLQVCGVYSPPYAKLLDLDHDEIASRIQAAKPDIVLVALGAPKQEKWIYMHYRKLGAPLCIGIGASLDFVAGKFSRAPVWMQRTGLEWVHRLSQEPRRLFMRYWTDFRFFIRALREHRRLLQRSVAPLSAPPQAGRWPGIASYEWIGRADAAAVESGALPEPAPQTGRVHVVADLSGVTFIDSAGLGLLLKAFKRCKEAGGGLVIVRPSEVVRELLAVSKLDRLLPRAESAEEANRLIYLDRVETRTSAEHDRRNHRVIFRCLGELNAANSDDFREMVQAKWEQEAAATILEIDFSRVDFIDSSGLGCLIRARRLVETREGAALKLTGVNDNLRNVITLAHLDGVLGLAKAS